MVSKTAYLSFVSLIVFSINALAQYPCSTVATQSQIEELREFYYDAYLSVENKRDTVYSVPIKFHIVRNDTGYSIIDEVTIEKVLDTLNYYFINASIQFEQCGAVNFIDNSSLTTFDAPQEENLLIKNNEKPRVINMYFADSVILNNVLLCGFAYLPTGDDPKRIYINNVCALSGNTISHEMGHMFSMLHTHGPTDFESSNELVDGSNCQTAGDELCDTPADPNLAGKVQYDMFNGGCKYTSNVVDAKGQPYNPLLDNIMSYTLPNCAENFTDGQYGRIFNSLFYHKRIELACYPDATPNENRLIKAYPNPFTYEIIVEYELTGKFSVLISLNDVMGKRVAVLYNGNKEAGLVRQRFIVGNTYLSQGVYIIQVEINNGNDIFHYKLLRTN
jgi:hypothetical protein